LVEKLAALGPGSIAQEQDRLPDGLVYYWHSASGTPALPPNPVLPAEAASRFYYRLVQRSRLSVLLWIRPEDPPQRSPTAILAYSEGPLHRNFMIGQQGRRIVFRLRTPATNESGTQPSLRSPPTLQAGKYVLVAATYDGRTSRLYVKGAPVASARMPTRRLPFTFDPPQAALTVAVFGMLAAGGLSGLAGSGRRTKLLMAALAAGTPAGILSLATGFQESLPLLIFLAAAAAGVGVFWAPPDQP
jgi:hypothetical protein